MKRRPVHPVIKVLWYDMQEQGWTYQSMAAAVGVHYNTIYGMFKGRSTNLHTVEACLNILGMTLSTEPLSSKDTTP